MKWFKHMTESWDDERLARAIGRGGTSGLALYGAFWRCAEIVAKQMDNKSQSCSVSYPVWRWCQLLFVRKSYLSSLLVRLQKEGLLVLEGDPKRDESVIVKMPNLLKYRDEYSKKSGHATKYVTPRTEGDTEEDKKEEIVAIAPELFEVQKPKVTAEEIYEAYPRKAGKGAAIKKIQLAMKKHDPAWLLAQTQAYAKQRQNEDPQFTPHPATWFNQERFSDEDLKPAAQYVETTWEDYAKDYEFDAEKNAWVAR